MLKWNQAGLKFNGTGLKWNGDLPSAPSSDMDGTVDLTWDKVRGANSYMIQKSPDPITGGSWTMGAISTKSSATLSGLTSGTKYWFRVAAIGAAGQGAWSDPATKMAAISAAAIQIPRFKASPTPPSAQRFIRQETVPN
ncbi:MAG: fibronectin type III domain-containing protein [Planctomycetota bacterium]